MPGDFEEIMKEKELEVRIRTIEQLIDIPNINPYAKEKLGFQK
jgi:hypothetical protein